MAVDTPLPTEPGATLRCAAEEFLAQRRIAVAGVSRDRRQPANLIYRRLRDAGHEVFAVNPAADTVEDDPCYARLAYLPVPVDGLVVVTPPEAAVHLARDAVATGIPRLWLHRGLGEGSSSPEAEAIAREHGVTVIPGGCPNMFGETSDPGHRCLRVLLQAGGRIPRRIT